MVLQRNKTENQFSPRPRVKHFPGFSKRFQDFRYFQDLSRLFFLLLSFLINSCQFLSILVNSCQFLSILVTPCQFLSILVDSCWFLSILWLFGKSSRSSRTKTKTTTTSPFLGPLPVRFSQSKNNKSPLD